MQGPGHGVLSEMQPQSWLTVLLSPKIVQTLSFPILHGHPSPATGPLQPASPVSQHGHRRAVLTLEFLVGD